ncbi:hypothetical protein [Flavobacterium chilense]|uniref:Uncharacterized protein n=1 Tax=Flavobacterium chilense TaxID=946677 RepID=A0A1M7D173_9FLAO|nr:hypothetical protein [Flavobacterium chilense]SHL73185.1 hypothetical protein SAMN05444484_102382 [Flavobacterium chilense]
MKNQPFCLLLGEEIIVTLFKDEINELQDYAMDAGDPLSYIMGTDAWLELQETGEQTALVGRTYDKTYFTCFIADGITQKIKENEECGIIVISSSTEFTLEDLSTNLGSNSTVDDIAEWIEDKIENNSMDINGLIFCYYTKEIRKKYHGDDYVD